MGLLDKLFPSSEDKPDIPGDEAPPEAVDFPTTDPTTIPPDEGDDEALEEGGSYV